MDSRATFVLINMLIFSNVENMKLSAAAARTKYGTERLAN